jgi:cytochrome c
MYRPNCPSTAALTISLALLIACNGASRSQTERASDVAAAPAGTDANAEAGQEPVTAQNTPTQQPAEPAQSPQSENASGGSGQVKFNNSCRTCHSMREGDNRLGPSLHGIIGRKAGSSPGYTSYSQAMVNSGIVWDEATLDRFLANPDAVVPGNNMKPFASIPDETVRQQIIDHLKSGGEG